MFLKQLACILQKRQENKPDPDIFIFGENITLVKQFKYLGILSDTNLSFKPHAKKITKIL